METSGTLSIEQQECRPASVVAPVEPRGLVHSLAELLLNPDALKPPEAIAPRALYRGRVSMFVGREKLSGKSTFLTAAGAAITRGEIFLGERCVQGSVLWVSADQEHASEIVQRALRFGADPERFHVLWPRDSFADLMKAFEQLNPFPVAAFIDTLANFVRVKDPHSSGEWPQVLMPLLRTARDLQCAVALSHHAVKSIDGGYRDSTAIGAAVDLILELRPDTGNPARRNVSCIGRWPAPGFAVELIGDRYQLVAGGELSLDAQVLAYLSQNPGSSKNAVRAGVAQRAEEVDTVLARLLSRGAIRNAGSDRRHAYEVVQGTAAAPNGDAEVPF